MGLQEFYCAAPVAGAARGANCIVLSWRRCLLCREVARCICGHLHDSLVGLGAMKSLYTADSGLHSSAEVVLIVGLCTFIAITFARKAYSVVGGYGPG